MSIVSKLTSVGKAQLEALRDQIQSVTEKRYIAKNPVATMTDLTAIETPANGETRQVESFLPDIVSYTFNTANTTDGVAAGDGTAGRWTTSDNSIDDGAEWEPSTDYAASEIFSFRTQLTDAKDADGNDINPDTLYFGEYVDGTGAPADTTSGATITKAELAKIKVSAGASSDRSFSITQAETDAVFLIN